MVKIIYVNFNFSMYFWGIFLSIGWLVFKADKIECWIWKVCNFVRYLSFFGANIYFLILIRNFILLFKFGEAPELLIEWSKLWKVENCAKEIWITLNFLLDQWRDFLIQTHTSIHRLKVQQITQEILVRNICMQAFNQKSTTELAHFLDLSIVKHIVYF